MLRPLRCPVVAPIRTRGQGGRARGIAGCRHSALDINRVAVCNAPGCVYQTRIVQRVLLGALVRPVWAVGV